jgi:hypothetical protein
MHPDHSFMVFLQQWSPQNHIPENSKGLLYHHIFITFQYLYLGDTKLFRALIEVTTSLSHGFIV